jgi:hypothetical protein
LTIAPEVISKSHRQADGKKAASGRRTPNASRSFTR